MNENSGISFLGNDLTEQATFYNAYNSFFVQWRSSLLLSDHLKQFFASRNKNLQRNLTYQKESITRNRWEKKISEQAAEKVPSRQWLFLCSACRMSVFVRVFALMENWITNSLIFHHKTLLFHIILEIKIPLIVFRLFRIFCLCSLVLYFYGNYRSWYTWLIVACRQWRLFLGKRAALFTRPGLAVAELRSIIWRRNFKYFVKMITLVL